MSFRKAIYSYLTTNCTLITTWYQPYETTRDTPKPYGVIKQGPKTLSFDNKEAAFTEIEIWPYIDREVGSFHSNIDPIVREIVGLLDKTTLTADGGDDFLLEYLDEGQDYYDEDLMAITRVIRFDLPTLR